MLGLVRIATGDSVLEIKSKSTDELTMEYFPVDSVKVIFLT